MLQRNTSGYVLTVPELGREFGPGDEVDHDNPICGFTPVEQAKASKAKAAAKPADDKDKETGK